MAGPLIETKLHVPRLRAQVVERPRLRDLLDRGWDARLTLLSAPAGFGKTTLLAEWLARSSAGRAVAWLSLDEGDSAPAVFWPHVVAAVQAGLRRAGRDFPDLPGATAPDDSFVAILLNQLTVEETPLVLILDDFHVADHPDIHSRVGFLVEHLPPHVNVVISTRADPALPLARLRAQGELVEIRAADLRLTASETSAYLNDVMGLALSGTDTTILEERTEGWIAALQLAVISLAGRSDASQFISGFAGSGRYIVDYLVEEVLERLPDDLRRFLLATCVLRRLTAPLCDAVTERAGEGRAMLDRLERQNLFLVPLDDHRQWYRYHHLFADVLRSHVGAVGTLDLPAIHRRASEWFDQNGERPEAIHHAIAAGDLGAAADLIERAIPDVRKHRQEALFRSWMQPIPDELVRARPVLSVGYAGVLASLGEFDGMAERLNEAERRVGTLTEADGFLAHIELYRTALAQVRGDMAAAAHHAARVLELAPLDDHLGRAGAAGFLGIVSWTNGDLERAAANWSECRRALRQEGHVADVQGTTIALSDILTTQGRVTDALRLCEDALGLAMAGGRPVVRGVADTHASFSVLHLERNELSAARDHLARSHELGEVFGLPQHAYRSRVAQARLDAREGRLAEALDNLREAERRYVSDFFPNVRPVPAMIARLQIRLGRVAEADRWVREAGVAIDDQLSFLREFDHITLARLCLARGTDEPAEARSALRLLDRLHEAATAGGRMGTVIEIAILQAMAHRLLNEPQPALDAIRRALALAAPEGHSRPFLDEGEALTGLLKLAAKRDGVSPFLAGLLDTSPAGGQDDVAANHRDLIEPLSDREVDVLRLLRSDLSGPDIARELAVSLNTMRTHTKNIFEKLGVNSRRAAVRRAEDMQLFGRSSDR